MNSRFIFIKNLIKSRISYPLHLNFFSSLSFLFGKLSSRIAYDNFRYPHYAYGVYEGAHRAKRLGLTEISVIEFGVANGRGLMAMALYAEKVEKQTGVKIKVIGFDSGEGLPPVLDYRDHPELYVTGDFPLVNREKLLSILPGNTKLIFLDLIQADWTTHVNSPIAFMSVDVDYYSSTKAILDRLITIPSAQLLPNSILYFDDTILPNHNIYQGELLAIEEFNNAGELRKIESFAGILRTTRILKHAAWINQIFQLHVLDHKVRNEAYRAPGDPPNQMSNKYLR